MPAGASRDVTNVTIRYFDAAAPSWGKETEEILKFELEPGKRRNLVADFVRDAFKSGALKAHKMTVWDARKVEGGLGSFRLDTHGLALVPAPEPVADMWDRKLVQAEYYPRLIEVAKKHNPGALHAIMIQHMTRKEIPGAPSAAQPYAGFAHTDAGPGSVVLWRKLLAENGVPEEEAKTCHIMMANIWHPLDHAAYKDPLCLLDGSTVTPADANGQQQDLVIYRVGYKKSTEEGRPKPKDGAKKERLLAKGLEEHDERGNIVVPPLIGAVFSPKHRWIFCSDQRTDEAWIFKQYDTRGGPAGPKMAFHNSFHDPFHDSDPSKPMRRSLEARVLLTFPPDSAPFSKL